jgi:hypothetical protein
MTETRNIPERIIRTPAPVFDVTAPAPGRLAALVTGDDWPNRRSPTLTRCGAGRTATFLLNLLRRSTTYLRSVAIPIPASHRKPRSPPNAGFSPPARRASNASIDRSATWQAAGRPRTSGLLVQPAKGDGRRPPYSSQFRDATSSRFRQTGRIDSIRTKDREAAK